MTNYEAKKFELQQAEEERVTFARYNALEKAREAVKRIGGHWYAAANLVNDGYAEEWFAECYPDFVEFVRNATEEEKEALSRALAREMVLEDEREEERMAKVSENAKHALDEAVARFEKTRSIEDYKSIEVNWDFWSDVYKDANGVRPHWFRLPLSNGAMRAFKAFRDMGINAYE